MFVKKVGKNSFRAIQLSQPLKIETYDGKTKLDGIIGDWLVMDEMGELIMLVNEHEFFRLFKSYCDFERVEEYEI